jgi:hypothetical protein
MADEDIASLLPRRISAAAKLAACGDLRKRAGLVGCVLAGAMLTASAQNSFAVTCKPSHFRPLFYVRTMGACGFDPARLSFQGGPLEQAECLMRGMDSSRNLMPKLETLPRALASRIGKETGLPTREALSAYLSRQGLEWDFAAYLWQPLSHANDNDPDAPMARYFVIHDTSGPNYRHRSFPADLDVNPKINNLKNFACSDGWGKAHVVVNRTGEMLLSHEFSLPWRETRFEQAANFAGALKGLFLHVELVQPRRSVTGRGRRNDAQSPDPAFTPAQYERLALLYVITSVRAGQWLIPAFHAAIDAQIHNGHDDPLNFDVESFGNSLDAVVDRIMRPPEAATAVGERPSETSAATSATDSATPAAAAPQASTGPPSLSKTDTARTPDAPQRSAEQGPQDALQGDH